jgi:hypothetical protein
VRQTALAVRIRSDLASAEEDRVEHLLGEPTGEGVLLADELRCPTGVGVADGRQVGSIGRDRSRTRSRSTTATAPASSSSCIDAGR